jgi:hypothetical protein
MTLDRSMYTGPKSESTGSFVQNKNSGYAFVPSDAGAKLLDYYRSKYGIPLEIHPIPPERIRPGLQGQFNESGLDSSGYGGASDTKRRVLFLNPQTTTPAHVFAHEAGHAFDPVLIKNHADMSEIRSPVLTNLYQLANKGEIQDPGAFLQNYIDFAGPRNAMTGEVIAQKAAYDTLKTLGIQHPEYNHSWFQGYPADFIKSGLTSATAAMTVPSNLPANIKDVYLTNALIEKNNPYGSNVVNIDANTNLDISDERLRKELNLALNPSYQKALKDINSRTQTYLDRQLGSTPASVSASNSNF